MAGEGEVGAGAGPAGDLYLEILEKRHPVFQRHGDDLHCTLSVPMTAAALGAELPLETLDGEENVDIAPGTQSGYEFLIRERGVPHLRGGGRGSLTVHVDVQTPTNLDTQQQELLEQLAALRGEEKPQGTPVEQQHTFFGRIKDAFSGK